MKKILPLLLTIIAAIVLTSCAPATIPKTGISYPAPWDTHSFLGETCTYDVVKYVGDGSEQVTSSGKLVYNLEKTDELYTLTMDFSITYTNSDLLDENYKGATDYMHSEAVFRRDTLTAVYTKKHAEILSNPTYSYDFKANYTEEEHDGVPALTAIYNGVKDDKPVNKTLTFKKSNYLDNEYLYYLVRALSKMGASLTENFAVVNWYECFKSNKFHTIPLIASCSNRIENVKIGDKLFSNFTSSEEGLKDEENKLISCFNVSIIINGIKTGSELSAMYSRCEYSNDLKTKLLPLKYITKESVSSGHISFYTEYILSDVNLKKS